MNFIFYINLVLSIFYITINFIKQKILGEVVKTGYKVCDAMTRKPIAVSPEMSAREAAVLMREKDIGSLVVKEKDQLKGYITEQGLVHKIIARNLIPEKTKLKEIMIKDVVTISPDADIHDALMLMKDEDVKQLPVLDGKKLVGLLTLKDILKIQPQLFELLVDKITLREEKLKPIAIAEGTCDYCGTYTKKLYEIEAEFLCSKCVKSRRIEVEF